MNDCKNCLHYEVCADVMKKDLFIKEKMLRIANPICKCFLDKSKVIELPCKVGDVVYKVSFVHKNITPLTVEGFLCNLSSWKVHCTHLIPSWVGNQKEHIYIAFSSFGKRVFLTSEEAEQALKERD